MNNNILISKSTFIQKNEKELSDVYKLSTKKLGSGAFGTVVRCRHRNTKQDRACKMINKKKVKNLTQF